MRTTIGRKIFIGFVVILVLMIVMGAGAYLSLQELKESADEVEAELLELNIAGRIRASILEALTINDYLITGNIEKEGYFAIVSANVDRSVHQMEETIDYDEEKVYNDRIKKNFALLKSKSDEVLNLADPAMKEFVTPRINRLVEEIDALSLALVEDVEALYNFIEDEVSELTKNMEQTKLFGLYAVIITTCLATVLAVVIGVMLSRSITGPLLTLRILTEHVAQGDLTQEARVKSRDEIGDLTDAFNQMVRDLRKSRAQLVDKAFVETVLNSMDDAISIIDVRDFTIVRVNSFFLKKVGLKEEEVIGKHCYEITHHRDDPCTPPDDICPLMDTVATGEYSVAEHVHYIKNGEKIYVEISTSPIKDKNGKVIQVVDVARDITERKRAEEKLKAFAEKLQRSNRELQDFAYIASHDLQEPLRKVTAFGDRLKVKYGDSLGDQGKDYLERMQNATGRMQTLINDLLTFSRVTTKAQPIVPVDLGAIVREVLYDLEVRIEQTKGQVEVGGLPIIDADPLQIRQLFQNLISNALKFHKKDEPPVVKVHARFIDGQNRSPDSSPSGNEFIQITVEDNGTGFDEKYLDRIFSVFQRLHGRNEYEGTGMGLAICRKIVERHGGDITAKSTPGQGTTFIVRLPVKQSVGGNG